MTYHSPEERAAVRTMLRRAAVVSVNDQGSQQLLNVSGFVGDKPKNLVRIAEFGFASNPPDGGEGLIVCPGGRSDRAMFLGGELAKYRPKNQPVGGVTIYDAFNNAISFVQNNIRIVAAANVTITAPSGLTINANVTVNGTIDATGDVKAGTISLEGHVHGGVQTGSGTTATPTG